MGLKFKDLSPQLKALVIEEARLQGRIYRAIDILEFSVDSLFIFDASRQDCKSWDELCEFGHSWRIATWIKENNWTPNKQLPFGMSEVNKEEKYKFLLELKTRLENDTNRNEHEEGILDELNRFFQQ